MRLSNIDPEAPTSAESSWRRITGASRPSLSEKLTLTRRQDLRELNRSLGFGTVSNLLLALPRANIYQDITKEDFYFCVEIERSEVKGNMHGNKKRKDSPLDTQ